MNVKELIDALSKYPDNMDVFMTPRKTEFHYGLLNSVGTAMVSFSDDPYDIEEKAHWEAPNPTEVICVILDEVE